jgi:hypothetical protein
LTFDWLKIPEFLDNMSASKFTRFKNKFSLHQKIKESESSAHRRNDRNDAGNDHRPHDKPTTTSLSSSGPHPVQASNANLCPIDELWNDAYDELRGQEGNLMKDYEATLCSDLATMVGSTVILSGSKVERKAQMITLLSRKVAEVKKNTWKLRFGDHDVQLKDLAQPVVDIIQWTDEHISGALSANPYASIAWAGVSLLLPVSHDILTILDLVRTHLYCGLWPPNKYQLGLSSSNHMSISSKADKLFCSIETLDDI